jgi:hypothetical protein
VLRHWGLNEPLLESAPELPLFTSGMRDPHIAAFSLPVFGEGNKLLAALALTGPSSRLTKSMRDSGVGKIMKETAYSLSLKLGAPKIKCDHFYSL